MLGRSLHVLYHQGIQDYLSTTALTVKGALVGAAKGQAIARWGELGGNIMATMCATEGRCLHRGMLEEHGYGACTRDAPKS